MTVRDLLLVAQIAICAVLVTSSLVAVRGLMRSLHSNFGFEPQNATLVDTDLGLAGYSADKVPPMQRRIIDAMGAIPGVTSVGLVGQYPPLHIGWNNSNVFTDETTDLTSSKAAAEAMMYSISPEYFHAAGTALLMGRSVTWHDDKNAPRVAVINQEFARRVFGSVANAMGGYYKDQDGVRIQVVGIVEDGKYKYLTEDPQPATFLPILQSPSNETWLVVRSEGDPQQLAPAMRSTLRDLDGHSSLTVPLAETLRPGHRLVLRRMNMQQEPFQEFLRLVRRRYGKRPVWMLIDEAPGHIAEKSQVLAAELGIELIWLPKQCPELNPMDQLWKELKGKISANFQFASIDEHALNAVQWLLSLKSREALRKAGILSKNFWLRAFL